MKKVLTLLLLLGLITTLHAQDKKVEKGFTNVKSVEITTSSGDIVVKKGQGSNVNVSLEHSYDNGAFTPVMEVNNGKLILKEKFSQGSHSGHSSWTLMVPDNMVFNVNSGSGNIDITGLTLEVRTNLGSGNVDISDVNGEMHFNTGSGDISLSNCQGELSFNTGSGSIVANDGTGSYKFNAGSGDIRLEKLSGSFEANTGSGDITAKSLRLEGAGSFNTGSGDAEVTLAGTLDQSISINSGSGDATIDFNGSPIEGEVIMTANQRNGEIVAPFKFDEEETINDGDSSPRIRKTAKLGNKNIKIQVGTGSGTATITK